VKDKILTAILIILVLLSLGYLIFQALPSFRIVSRWEMKTFEGHRAFILDWSYGGKEMLSATFYSEAERARFIEYLKKKGRVEE